MELTFKNRKDAGEKLAAALKKNLSEKEKSNSVILALARGGVPVAREISRSLNIPMEVLIVRKIGHPLNPEYGVGAIAEDGVVWIDSEVEENLAGLSKQIQKIIKKERQEIVRRVNLYRKNRRIKSLKNRTVIIVDDGIATGVTAFVAAKFAETKAAIKIILAVPACAGDVSERFKSAVDKVICLNSSSDFSSLSEFYDDFGQVSDEEVISACTA